MKEVLIMTKKEKFAVLAKVVESAKVENKAELLEFIGKEIAMLEKRSSKSGETKKDKEREELKAELLKALKTLEKPVTISDFQSKFPQFMPPKFSNQKISAMFRQMKEAGLIDKKVEKKKSYFFAV